MQSHMVWQKRKKSARANLLIFVYYIISIKENNRSNMKNFFLSQKGAQFIGMEKTATQTTNYSRYSSIMLGGSIHIAF